MWKAKSAYKALREERKTREYYELNADMKLDAALWDEYWATEEHCMIPGA